MSHFSSKSEKLPAVVCADRFYMDSKAMRTLETAGNVIWADCKDERELVEKVRDTNARVIISEYFKITERIMGASPALEGIVVWGVGYEHVDVDAASASGLYVVNTPGSNAESVAEHTFGLLLSLSRRLFQTDAFVRKGGWVSREEARLPHELRARDLYGKTLGIIGIGAVGSRVARIAHSFNMRVLAFDPYVSAGVARERGAELADLEKLLRESDFVTLHVVLTEETEGMIGAEELNLMKPTAYLFNASRGPVIDEKALISALKERKIAGAGLDVFDEEPIDLGNPLLEFDNVIVTPHCAGNSEEALRSTSLMVSEEVVRILHNQAPKNLVNRSQL